MPGESSKAPRLTAVLSGVITGISIAGCVAFLIALIGYGVQPAAHAVSSRGEVLSVLPTGKEQNPVSRAFDQVTGVWEAVARTDLDLRVELLPRECLEQRECRLEDMIEPGTRLVVAPGTSKGTDLVVPEGSPRPRVPILLTSVTGDETIRRLKGLGATSVALPNSEMAKQIANRISEETGRRCRNASVDPDESDHAYSVPLAEDIREALAGVCSGVADRLYVLIGNEPWWISGERENLKDASMVVLSDGLSSTRVLKGVRRAVASSSSEARIFAVRISLEDPGTCRDREHRELTGMDAVSYAWHTVAREATCLFLRSLGERPPVFQPGVYLEPLHKVPSVRAI